MHPAWPRWRSPKFQDILGDKIVEWNDEFDKIMKNWRAEDKKKRDLTTIDWQLIANVLQTRKIEFNEAEKAYKKAAQGWKDLMKLSTLSEVFEGLDDLFVAEMDKFKIWYDLETPETDNFPCNQSEKLSPFQRLLLIRCFRPDRS